MQMQPHPLCLVFNKCVFSDLHAVLFVCFRCHYVVPLQPYFSSSVVWCIRRRIIRHPSKRLDINNIMCTNDLLAWISSLFISSNATPISKNLNLLIIFSHVMSYHSCCVGCGHMHTRSTYLTSLMYEMFCATYYIASVNSVFYCLITVDWAFIYFGCLIRVSLGYPLCHLFCTIFQECVYKNLKTAC